MQLTKTISTRRRQQGLTILEIMVASGLMIIIIFGLLAMFNQTQRAFKSSLRQVDVLEGGRAIMDMVVRDLEQLASPPGISNTVTFHADRTYTFSFLNGTEAINSNRLTEVFVTWPESLTWHGVAFRPEDDGKGLATLYRGQKSTNYVDLVPPAMNNFLYTQFDAGKFAWYRVAQGIVHFHVRPLDTNGLPYNWNGNSIQFTNDIPQFLELELGIAEPELIEQVKGMPNDTVAREYLQKQAGRIHMFRQQIPIRTASR